MRFLHDAQGDFLKRPAHTEGRTRRSDYSFRNDLTGGRHHSGPGRDAIPVSGIIPDAIAYRTEVPDF